MASKISDYSSTAGLNTSVNGIFIGEGMAPSDVNNAMREILAELKNQQSGADGSDFTVGGNSTVTGTSTIGGNATVGGNLTVSGTGSVKIATGTSAQRPTASTGMIRFNTDLGSYEGYNGSVWTTIGGGATGGGTDQVFANNSAIVTTSYTLPTGKNSMSVGAITINSGVTVTIPSGQRWVIL